MADFPDTPASLLARIAAQTTGQSDETAWVRLFELYAPAIRKFAEGLGARDESEDVAQEVFARLVNVLRGGVYHADAGKFRCYLATMIRRELVSRWRKAQVRAQCVSLESLPPDEQPEVQPDAAAVVEAKWRLARHEAAVWHALTKTALSKQSREIYRAYALEERPIGEVAARFGVSRNVVAQVKARVNRMIATLESRIRD